MPNIRSFDAPAGLGLQPSETGIEALASGARREGAFFNQAGEAMSDTGRRAASALQDAGDVAVKYEDHREISAGAANGAQFVANFNDLWNNTIKNADPNDPSVKQKFLEENLEPALEKFKSGFNTEKSQEWAEHFVDQYRQHMFEKTSADMSTMAGVAVRANAEKTINSLASAVASDPSSLPFALESVDHSIGATVDSSPSLDAASAASIKGEVGLHAKEQIVKSAISGMIMKNPNVDLDAIEKKYSDYLKPGEMLMFQKAAQSQAKVNAYYDRQTALLAKQQADLRVHASSNKAIADNVTIDPQTGKPTIKPQYFKDTLEIVRQNPDAPSAAATFRAMTDWGESQQNKEIKTADDPATLHALSDRLFDPTNPTTEIDLMRAQTQGKLSDHSFTQLNGMVKELRETPLKGPIYQDTMKAVHETLVLNGVGVPGKDDVGERKYASFMQNFLPQYLSKYRAGTLEPNALDVKDPNSMISKAMEPFRRGLTERINDYLSSLGGVKTDTAAAPRISSKEEYDKLQVGTVYISAKDGQRYEKR